MQNAAAPASTGGEPSTPCSPDLQQTAWDHRTCSPGAAIITRGHRGQLSEPHLGAARV